MTKSNDLGLQSQKPININTTSPAQESRDLEKLMELHQKAENLLATRATAAPAPLTTPPRKEAGPRPAPPKVPAPPVPSSTPTAEPSKADQSRLFFTGRLMVGKDHCANAAGASLFGFADPLYYLAEYFFGPQEKNKCRAFFQTVGMWGRGFYDPELAPFTAERAAFVRMIRDEQNHFVGEYQVDWSSFGRNENIWLEACLRRVATFQSVHPGRRVAVTNVRFSNEFRSMKAAGWSHWHVMCSGKTWQERLVARGLKAQGPEVKHVSEQLAASLDHNVTRILSAGPNGRMLKVIWSDDKVAPVSHRLHSVASFLQDIAIQETPA